MRRAPILIVTAVIAVLLALIPATSASAAPARSDSTTENVYFVHGIDLTAPAGTDCNGDWADAKWAMRNLWGGWRGGLYTVGFYAGDRNCDFYSSAGDQNTSIRTLGADLAWFIYRRETSRGVSIDMVGHSMGGLIIRAALTGVQNGWFGFPPYLYVEDVVTLATPHDGTNWGNACALSWLQCREMEPGSALLNSLAQGPQSAQGTDWTLTGSFDDPYVSEGSAVGMDYNVGHRHQYRRSTEGVIVNHTTIRQLYSGVYTVRSWHHYTRVWKETPAGWAPLTGMRWGLYYWSRE